jgi:ankyrin repeat protein
MLAASKGYFEVVKLLLNNGTDVSLKDMIGWTALDYAKEYEREEVVRLLKEHGVKE